MHFLSLFSVLIFLMSLIFLFKGFVYMVEYEIMSLNSSVIYFSLLFDWMCLMFLSYVFFLFLQLWFFMEKIMWEETCMSIVLLYW